MQSTKYGLGNHKIDNPSVFDDSSRKKNSNKKQKDRKRGIKLDQKGLKDLSILGYTNLICICILTQRNNCGGKELCVVGLQFPLRDIESWTEHCFILTTNKNKKKIKPKNPGQLKIHNFFQTHWRIEVSGQPNAPKYKERHIPIGKEEI